MFENSKYRELFVQEALEHVDNLNQTLLKYEEDPKSKDLVDALFRSAHSLKGMAATMDYEQIREICKSMEEIFDRFRQNEEKITTESSDVLFYGIELLRQLIQDDHKVINLKKFLECVENPNLMETNTYSQKNTTKTKSTIAKVRMEDLDIMMNLVGELMITKMRLEQNNYSYANAETQEIVMNLSRIITDLQHRMMIIRLVPMDQIFDRFSKMIRDVSISLGKKIKLEMDGGGIEVDRTVLDAIIDPLLHLLRNSVDHGIETPDERKELGKTEYGTIKLSVIRKGDKVEINVADDGRGIDIESIKIKSIEKKIVTIEQLEIMSDEEIIGLLGTPGLSTAKTVTDISGRGVGMDVVLTQVKSFGGQVKILTENGKGTQIILSMPLSLSIMGGLVVNVGDQKFVLPLMSLITTLTINVNDIKNFHGKEMIKNGTEILPILRLSYIFGINSMCDMLENEQVTLVIVEKDGKRYGLVVDSLEQEREIVVKRLDIHFGNSQTFSDATILPDGRVALILDPAMLI